MMPRPVTDGFRHIPRSQPSNTTRGTPVRSPGRCLNGEMPSAPTSTASWRVAVERVEIWVADRSVLALTPSNHLVRVGLVVPVLERVVDASLQPASACAALAEASDREGISATAVEVAARQAMVEGAARAGAWAPSSKMCLLRAFGGVAFPLLAVAYDAGAAPLLDAPRWAANASSAITALQIPCRTG